MGRGDQSHHHSHHEHAGITALGRGMEEDYKPDIHTRNSMSQQRPHTTGAWSRAPLPPVDTSFFPPSTDAITEFNNGHGHGATGLGAGIRRASTPVFNPYLAMNTRPWGSFSANGTTNAAAGSGNSSGPHHPVAVDWDLLLGDSVAPTEAFGGGADGQLSGRARAPSSATATSRPSTGQDTIGIDGSDQVGRFMPGAGTGHQSPRRGSVASAAQQAKHKAMLASIANQVGYLEGKDDEPYLKVHYFRISGRTSLHPGINRISLKLRLRAGGESGETAGDAIDGPFAGATIKQQDDDQAVATLPLSTTDYPSVDDSPPALITPHLGPAPGTLFEPDTQMPLPQVYMPLLAIFFDVVGQHFPSVQPKRIYKRIEEGTMSAFLCNGESHRSLKLNFKADWPLCSHVRNRLPLQSWRQGECSRGKRDMVRLLSYPG